MPPRSNKLGTKDEFHGDNEDAWWRSESSGSEAEDGPGRAKENVEEGLYDVNMDDKDAIWADEARKGRVSDAILSW